MKLKTPLSEKDVRKLKVGDKVELSGVIVTARDEAHKFMIEHSPKDLPFSLEGGVIYHCGPVVEDGRIIAAGPTTSNREEPYEAEVIERYGVRAVVGKGGMGEKTSKALKDLGAVYLSAVGGAGIVAAECVKNVIDVFMKDEFGIPEAFWILEVEDFPLIVTMDAEGASIFRRVFEESKLKLDEVLKD